MRARNHVTYPHRARIRDTEIIGQTSSTKLSLRITSGTFLIWQMECEIVILNLVLQLTHCDSLFRS